jgi:hypothetical protein
MLTRRDDYVSEEKRVALVVREVLHNAYAQKANEMILFNLRKDSKEYFVLGHNGNAFKSIEDLKSCMRPSVTGGDGIQGNGMKSNMFLTTKTNEEAEFVIHNRSDCEYSVRLTCENFNDALVKDVSNEWNHEIKSVMGSNYKRYNVYYIYRYSNANTIKNKEHNGLIVPSYARLISEITPLVGKIRLRAKLNTIHGKLCKYKTIDFSDSSRTFNIPSIDKVDEEFCVDQEFFNTSFSIKEGDAKYDFDVNIQLVVYPNLLDGFNRPIVLNGEEKGLRRNDYKHSNELLFVTCDYKGEYCNKDLTRASTEPYYTSSNVRDLLAILGIFCPKKDFSSKLKQFYPEFTEAAHWLPVVKARVNLIPKQSGSIFALGGLNEFFQTNDPHQTRKLVNIVFQKIANENPTNLVDFKERMKSHCPYDCTDDLAPIPKYQGASVDRTINVLKEVADSEGNKSWKIIRTLEPGDHVNFVKLEYGNGKPVLDAIFNVTPGVDFRLEYDNVYSISVSPLIRIDENGKKSLISVDEYKHLKQYLPKKNYHCDIGVDKYNFTFRVLIPKRPGGHGGPNSEKGMENRTSEIDHEAYQEFEPDLFGVYSNGRLVLNKNNTTILQMASFNYDMHPSLYRKWLSIYEKATKVARRAHILHQEYLEIDFNKTKKEEGQNKFGSSEQLNANSHLMAVFESEEALSLLNDVKKINQDAEKD